MSQRTGCRFGDKHMSQSMISDKIWDQSSEKEVSHPILTKAARLQLFGKSPVGVYLRLNRRIWQLLPSRVRNFSPVREYGTLLHQLVCLHSRRQQ